MITQKLVISSLLTFSIITAKVPTEFEAASLAKQMVAKNGVGDLVVDVKHDGETLPFAKTELYAINCGVENAEHLSGSILLFQSSLSVTANSLLTNSKQASFSLHKSHFKVDSEVVTNHRLTLVGNVQTNLPVFGDLGYNEISECFFLKHPTARRWEVSSDFRFYRLVVEKLYYDGGFGDEHFTGWIEGEEYRDAPVSGLCYAWGDACKAVADEDLTIQCCPMDDDNLMHECCGKFEKKKNENESEVGEKIKISEPFSDIWSKVVFNKLLANRL